MRTKKVCSKCGREIGSSVYNRHIAVCKGPKESFKLNHEGLTCQYCGKECKNRNSLCNHERLCKENPNRQDSSFKVYNKTREHGDNQYTKARRLGLPDPEVSKETREKISKWMKENNPSFREEVRKKQSIAAKKNNFGGWHTSRTFIYKGIKLDSSYEVRLAEDLDRNNVKWVRPNFFVYEFKGEEHRYYPDFYLPEENIYIDTKNDYLINNPNPKFGIKDLEKIQLVSEQNNIKILVLDKNNLSWFHLKSKIELAAGIA